MATYWTTAELVGRIRRWQADGIRSVPGRFGYVIQDFEPGFYPFSAAMAAGPRDVRGTGRDASRSSTLDSCATTSTAPGSRSSTSTPSSRGSSPSSARRWRARRSRARGRSWSTADRARRATRSRPSSTDFEPGARATRMPRDGRSSRSVEAHPDDRPRWRGGAPVDRQARPRCLRGAPPRVGDRHLADGLAPPELPAARDGAPRDAGADQPVRCQGPRRRGIRNIRTVDDISAEGLATRCRRCAGGSRRIPEVGRAGSPGAARLHVRDATVPVRDRRPSSGRRPQAAMASTSSR